MAAYGIFKDLGDAVGHNDTSRLLRSDHPHTQADVVKWAGSPIQWKAYGEFEQILRSGESALGSRGLFGALEDAPEEAEHFNRTMEAVSALQIGAIPTAYDFSIFRTICDVGGGRGHLLAAILDAAPRSTGILVDLPAVIHRQLPPSSRIEQAASDILVGPLPTADAYVIKNVLHDWSDEKAVQILKNVRLSAPRHAKVVIVEALLPEPPKPTPGLIHDLAMLVLNNGRERALSEFDTLLKAAGWRLQTVAPAQDLSLIIACIKD